jgi:hypothetical protein
LLKIISAIVFWKWWETSSVWSLLSRWDFTFSYRFLFWQIRFLNRIEFFNSFSIILFHSSNLSLVKKSSTINGISQFIISKDLIINYIFCDARRINFFWSSCLRIIFIIVISICIIVIIVFIIAYIKFVRVDLLVVLFVFFIVVVIFKIVYHFFLIANYNITITCRIILLWNFCLHILIKWTFCTRLLLTTYQCVRILIHLLFF